MYNVTTFFFFLLMAELGLETFLNFTDLNLYLLNPPRRKSPH